MVQSFLTPQKTTDVTKLNKNTYNVIWVKFEQNTTGQLNYRPLVRAVMGRGNVCNTALYALGRHTTSVLHNHMVSGHCEQTNSLLTSLCRRHRDDGADRLDAAGGLGAAADASLCLLQISQCHPLSVRPQTSPMSQTHHRSNHSSISLSGEHLPLLPLWDMYKNMSFGVWGKNKNPKIYNRTSLYDTHLKLVHSKNVMYILHYVILCNIQETSFDIRKSLTCVERLDWRMRRERAFLWDSDSSSRDGAWNLELHHFHISS